jgi:hypothetical protein
VVAYLKERPLQDGDDELEQALLRLNHPLIDLALAQYGHSIDVLKTLFHMGKMPLRVAVLSNQALGRQSFLWLSKLFDGENLKAYLVLANDEEICALFQNPKIPNEFLSGFLRGNELWAALSEEKKILIVGEALPRNERMKTRYNGEADYEYLCYNPVFDAAWELAEKVPVTGEWAQALYALYIVGKLIPISSMKNPLEVATRWQGQNRDNNACSAYFWVRTGLARLALAESKTDAKALLESEDQAFRIAAYSYAELTPEQVAQAYERDGEFASDNLAGNKFLYKYEEESPSKPLEEPVSKADFKELALRLTSIKEDFRPLITKLNDIYGRLGFVWWFSLGALIGVISGHF